MTEIKAISNVPKKCYLIIDGDNIVIMNGNHSAHVLSKADNETLLNAVLGFETAKLQAKIKAHDKVDPMLTITSEATDISTSPITYQVLRIRVSERDYHQWPVVIYNDKYVVDGDLPNNLVGEIVDHLVKAGYKKPYSAKLYNEVELVKEVPADPKPGVAYVVVDEYGVETGESVVYDAEGNSKVVTDTPEPDPTDPDTIPDTEEKEEVTEPAIGGVEEPVAAMLNQTADTKELTMNATQTASIINSKISDSIVTITVKE